MAITVLLSFTACNGQIKNATTATVKIYGNCGMCKSTIEKAGNSKNTALIDWNKETKIATLKYDSTKTNQDEVLKRIALAGYDSDKFLAPDEAYADLPGCCQYERVNKSVSKKEPSRMETHDHSSGKQETNPLKEVSERYFAVKDALVKSDGTIASAKAKDLLDAINLVKMEALTAGENTIWMNASKGLSSDAGHIARTKDIDLQRGYFMSLSSNMYELAKISRSETPVYYQHCPMADNGKGANWLSKENAVKNPYYGAQMLTCGKTIATIKK